MGVDDSDSSITQYESYGYSIGLSDSIDFSIIVIVNYYRDSDTALGPVTIVGLDAVGNYISNLYPKIPKLNATDSCTIRS